MLKLGTNAAISSRGDSSKFTLVKRYLRNDNILVVSYTLCCINVNNNTQFSKTKLCFVLGDLVLINAYNGKTHQLTRVLLRNKKSKNEYMFNGCFLVWIKLKLEAYTISQLSHQLQNGVDLQVLRVQIWMSGPQLLSHILEIYMVLQNGINAI